MTIFFALCFKYTFFTFPFLHLCSSATHWASVVSIPSAFYTRSLSCPWGTFGNKHFHLFPLFFLSSQQLAPLRKFSTLSLCFLMTATLRSPSIGGSWLVPRGGLFFLLLSSSLLPCPAEISARSSGPFSVLLQLHCMSPHPVSLR